MKYLFLLVSLFTIQINAMKYIQKYLPKNSLVRRFHDEYQSISSDSKNPQLINDLELINMILEHSEKNKEISQKEFEYTLKNGILSIGINRSYNDNIMGEEGYRIFLIKNAILNIINSSIQQRGQIEDIKKREILNLK